MTSIKIPFGLSNEMPLSKILAPELKLQGSLAVRIRRSYSASTSLTSKLRISPFTFVLYAWGIVG